MAGIQPAIAAEQVAPGGELLDPSARSGRGALLVYFEFLHPEQEALMLNGSGCLVQTYSTNRPGTFGHIIAATGVVKRVGLRLKV